MKLLKIIANLAYGSRREVERMFRDGRITDDLGEELSEDGLRLSSPRGAPAVAYTEVRVDGEPLDPEVGSVLILHKPVGYTCSTRDHGAVIYELLPARLRWRKPLMSPVGRLDRETSGLLLLTDDGGLLHRITSPKHATTKVYEITLARDLSGNEAEVFASGTLMLESETTPLKPAHLEVQDTRRARLTLTEGRYHQVRRMFAALGNHVETLHRSQIGALTLADLPSAQWRVLTLKEIGALDQRQT